MVGPIAGATEMTIEMLPIMRPREAGGTSVITVVISSGIMIAVPDGLHDAADEQQLEAGRERRDQRAEAEQRHREDEDRPGVEPLQQEAGDRDDHGHGEHERRRQPLGRAGA